MDALWWRLSRGALVAALLGLGSCASTPSRFYILNTLPVPETAPATAAARGPVIGMGPITLPKYLDRPQILSRAGRNQVALGEFDRWAEPLQENVSRVLAENLALLIPTDHVLLNPWPGSATLDYQVRVDVRQFEGWLGGESTLLARWSVLDRAEHELISQKAHLQVPTGARDYDAMAGSLNQLLDTLSRDIATAIQRLASPAAARP
jgi:uncharacterized lipoprotein YmbA